MFTAQKRKLDLDTENSKRKFLNGMPFMSKSLQNKGKNAYFFLVIEVI